MKTRVPCDYTLILTFTGPLLSQAPGVLAFGLDTATQRYRGEPVLNGSLIKGNIRHAMTEFAELIPDSGLRDQPEHKDQKHHVGYINRWFGPIANKESDRYATLRAAIDFDFFWQLKQPLKAQKSTAYRTRIKLEKETGKVETGALQAIEDCFASSEEVVFVGKLSARFSNAVEKQAFTHWLGKALDYIPAMGSYKGTGFGKLKHWTLDEQDEIKTKPVKERVFAEGQTRIGIILRLDRPFCLGKPRTPDSNRIVSAETITGNVIKGIIARQYLNGKIPKEVCFDDIIISHALPMLTGMNRPSPLPLSLAYNKEHKRSTQCLVDMAGIQKAPKTIPWAEAPVFQPDWKTSHRKQAEKEWGSSSQHPDRYLSIRRAYPETNKIDYRIR